MDNPAQGKRKKQKRRQWNVFDSIFREVHNVSSGFRNEFLFSRVNGRHERSAAGSEGQHVFIWYLGGRKHQGT
ncbi:hypothetical protein NPIL_382071, partial [Nephila pilipes]